MLPHLGTRVPWPQQHLSFHNPACYSSWKYPVWTAQESELRNITLGERLNTTSKTYLVLVKLNTQTRSQQEVKVCSFISATPHKLSAHNHSSRCRVGWDQVLTAPLHATTSSGEHCTMQNSSDTLCASNT